MLGFDLQCSDAKQMTHMLCLQAKQQVSLIYSFWLSKMDLNVVFASSTNFGLNYSYQTLIRETSKTLT